MADSKPADKHPPAPFFEDVTESDDEKGDSSASKPASNSASKRSHKVPKTRQSSPSKARSTSNVSLPEPSNPLNPEVKDDVPQPAREAASQASAKDEVRSDPGSRRPHNSRRRSQVPPPPASSGRPPQERKHRSPDRQHRERDHRAQPCACSDCCLASHHGRRPGINPLQQDQRANTFSARPHHGPPPHVPYGAIPPGYMPTPGHAPHPSMRPMYPGGYAGGHPQPPRLGPAFDPRRADMPPPPRPSMHAPSQATMPPSLVAVRGPPSPIKLPVRPAIHQSERKKQSSSMPKFSSKISTYDTAPAAHHAEDEEHFSARPTSKPQMPGGFESDSYSSESPPDSPEYFYPEQHVRPHPLQRATTSAVTQIHRAGHGRSRSDYPIDPAYVYGQPQPAPNWDQHSDYDVHQSYHGGRRGSNASNWTHRTSASDPPRHGYVQYAHGHHGDYAAREDAARNYMDQARGHPEERVTAETLQQLSNGPRSTRSNHSHRRSQHSMSDASSRYRGTEGSVKLILPIAAAEGARIQLMGDMGDREVTVRPSGDPGEVEVMIGTINGGERRYLKSGSQASRAPTMSSGGSRHATRGRADGEEQFRDRREHRRQSRAPSSRKS